jgi:hypothetical protein
MQAEAARRLARMRTFVRVWRAASPYSLFRRALDAGRLEQAEASQGNCRR